MLTHEHLHHFFCVRACAMKTVGWWILVVASLLAVTVNSTTEEGEKGEGLKYDAKESEETIAEQLEECQLICEDESTSAQCEADKLKCNFKVRVKLFAACLLEEQKCRGEDLLTSSEECSQVFTDCLSKRLEQSFGPDDDEDDDDNDDDDEFFDIMN